MKRLLALALIPATVLASECVLQDRTVSRSAVTIAERSRITPEDRKSTRLNSSH